MQLEIKDDDMIELEDFSGQFNEGAEFQEVDTDSFYIPSSYYCYFKCYEKIMRKSSRQYNKIVLNRYTNAINNLRKVNRIGMNAYGNSIKSLRKLVRNQIGKNNLLTEWKYDTINNKPVVLDNSAPKNKNYSIYFMHIDKCFYQAVLLKTPLLTKKLVMEIASKLVVNKRLANESHDLRLPSSKEITTKFFCYNIDISSNRVAWTHIILKEDNELTYKKKNKPRNRK